MSVLDWRDLAPEPDWHECDCRHCEWTGEREAVEWPVLVIADGDGTDYVTDRYLMIRGDLAPIPDDYEGTILPGRPNASDLLSALAAITIDAPDPKQHFRWTTLRALKLTGWDLRRLGGSDKRTAVVDQDGRPIGIAVAATWTCDDDRSPDFTQPYGDLAGLPEVSER